jgi:pSer/pThr/pTyr-binding forkhead associated (FHA) protein
MSEANDPEKPSQSSGLPFDALREDARRLSDTAFEDHHGDAFLILTETDLNQPAGPAMTEVNLAGFDELVGEHTAGLSQLAFPILRTQRSVGHLVTIGRTANNDIVIPDLSVSRFHAFAKPGEPTGLAIQDAGSTNGTTVNGSSVPSQGHGSPVDLKSGDNVRLGQVELTFVDATALLEYLRARE